jgi:aminoglycoside 6'-N-acetyltransferase I
MTHEIQIVPATVQHLAEWAKLRIILWEWDTVQDHADQAAELYLSGNPDHAAFVAVDHDGIIVAFAEATLRRDYVEGCDSTPVTFLEGIFVNAEHRKRGVARLLSEAIASWGKSAGCTEFASNALLDNVDSHAFHVAIGFAETERVVFFKRPL